MFSERCATTHHHYALPTATRATTHYALPTAHCPLPTWYDTRVTATSTSPSHPPCRYDTSVTAKTDVELIAVPKALVQKAIASDDYFQVT